MSTDFKGVRYVPSIKKDKHDLTSLRGFNYASLEFTLVTLLEYGDHNSKTTRDLLREYVMELQIREDIDPTKIPRTRRLLSQIIGSLSAHALSTDALNQDPIYQNIQRYLNGNNSNGHDRYS